MSDSIEDTRVRLGGHDYFVDAGPCTSILLAAVAWRRLLLEEEGMEVNNIVARSIG